jgi:hypothetical protein
VCDQYRIRGLSEAGRRRSCRALAETTSKPESGANSCRPSSKPGWASRGGLIRYRDQELFACVSR